MVGGFSEVAPIYYVVLLLAMSQGQRLCRRNWEATDEGMQGGAERDP
jgi:hypothetical protein